MTKLEFIFALKGKLAGFPEDDVTERLGFYTEMIEDRMEEGMSEADAVAAVGSVDEIASQIKAELSPSENIKKVKAKKKLRVWEIVLLALGSPLWLSLLIAAFAILISLYAVLWSVAASMWAVFGAFVGSAFGGAVFGASLLFGAYSATGAAIIGAALFLAGLSVFTFFGCKALTVASAWLTKKGALFIVRCFKRGDVEYE